MEEMYCRGDSGLQNHGCSQSLLEELKSSVCLEYFTDPLTIDCGHSFCQACLVRSWGGAKNPLPCPECHKHSEPRDFLLSRRLEKLAAIAWQAGPHKLLRQGEEERLCEQHQQILKLFCQDDETPLCIACFRDPEHNTHNISPVQEVAEEYKEKVQQRRQTIWSKFEKMRKFLAEEEAQQPHNLSLEEEKVLQKMEEMKSQVSQQGTILEGVDRFLILDPNYQSTALTLTLFLSDTH
ncbi:E3 ubiquitin-protein ligase TRIM17-like [Ornithorhynchus anatinus]|uniref:E3 ubiquitin-protein ligase TRIM17-like n=1 Tax=Ornithorhynchus anatinus TaxID=9258 RepID=UPI0019D4E702|nr:E3 ubiquitin-protein ligase TRIM17-like [Ornithorhynchus anatinus]